MPAECPSVLVPKTIFCVMPQVAWLFFADDVCCSRGLRACHSVCINGTYPCETKGAVDVSKTRGLSIAWRFSCWLCCVRRYAQDGGGAIGPAYDMRASIAMELGERHLTCRIQSGNWITLGVDYLSIGVDFRPAF